MKRKMSMLAGVRPLATLAVILGLSAVGPSLASAQEVATTQDLPSAETIIDRYVEAIGGEQAIRSQKPRHVAGTVELPAQGISGEMEIFTAPPDRMVTRLSIPGMGEVKVGYDGETGWMVHPALGPMTMEGLMLRQTRQEADLMAALHPERFVKSAETVERTEFEGHDAYKVRIVTQWDEEYFELYDVESGLLVGTVRKQASPMGDIDATVVLSDYREVDGLRMPGRSVQKVMGMQQIVTISEVETVDLQDDVFTPPPEIQALLQEEEGEGGGR